MIKSTELRIGNLLNDVGSQPFGVQASDLVSLSQSEMACKINLGFNPIQITEEMLVVNCGFFKRKDEIYSIQYTDEFENTQVFQVRLINYGTPYFEYRCIYDSDFHGKVNYLHDLQNKFNSASRQELYIIL